MKIKPAKILSGMMLLLIFLYLLCLIFIPDKVIFNNEQKVIGLDKEYPIFYTLFSRLGYDFRYWHSENPPPDGSVLVIFDYHKESDGLKKLVPWIERGNKAFLFGARETTFVEDIFFRLGDYEDHFEVTEGMKSATKLISFETNVFLKVFNRKSESLLKGEAGDIIKRVFYGKGEICVLSDSDLLKPPAIYQKNIAVLMNDLLKLFYHQPLYVQREVISHHKKGSAIFFDPKMTLFFIQFFIISIVFFLFRGMRVGKPAVYQPEGRREIREHLEAIGHLFFKFRSYRCVNDINREYFIFSLRKMMGAGAKVTESKMKAFILKNLNEKKQKILEADLDPLFKKVTCLGQGTMTSTCLKMNALLKQIKNKRIGG